MITERTDTALKRKGMDVLIQELGYVDAERFVALMNKEPFDYTKWRRQFFGDKTVSEINDEAADYSRNHPFTPQKPQVPIQREN